MPRSVIIATASAGLALAFTALLAAPAMAMSFSDYDGTAGPLSDRIEAGSSFSGRFGAAARKREREARQLDAIRAARRAAPAPLEIEARRAKDTPFALSFPFTAVNR